MKQGIEVVAKGELVWLTIVRETEAGDGSIRIGLTAEQAQALAEAIREAVAQ